VPRVVLTFFAQDHAAGDMVYSNADITKAEQALEIIAFADYWKNATGSDPGLLVFDSQLTTYAILDELSSRGITWLTLRQRGKANSPASTPSRRQNGRLPSSPVRPLPAAPHARRHDQAVRHQHQSPADRHQEHRPRRTHPADHQ